MESLADPTSSPEIFFSVLVLIASMSIYFSWRFALTQRELLRPLRQRGTGEATEEGGGDDDAREKKA